MADPIIVKLKDGAGNILHPETDWSVIQDRPSIHNEGKNVYIDPYETIHMEAQDMHVDLTGDAVISTSETGGTSVSLADYPVNWNKLNNRPFQEILDLNRDSTAELSSDKSSIGNAVFGMYGIRDYTATGLDAYYYYPAFAVVGRIAGGPSSRGFGIYLDSKGMMHPISDMANFIGLLETSK